MIKRLSDSQEGVLHLSLQALSAIPTPWSVTSTACSKTVASQQFSSPLYNMARTRSSQRMSTGGTAKRLQIAPIQIQDEILAPQADIQMHNATSAEAQVNPHCVTQHMWDAVTGISTALRALPGWGRSLDLRWGILWAGHLLQLHQDHPRRQKETSARWCPVYLRSMPLAEVCEGTASIFCAYLFSIAWFVLNCIWFFTGVYSKRGACARQLPKGYGDFRDGNKSHYSLPPSRSDSYPPPLYKTPSTFYQRRGHVVRILQQFPGWPS